MKRLWKLSLVVLLLGNAIDGIATYLGVQQVGIGGERSPFARWFMVHLGPLPDLILIKIIFTSFLLLTVVHCWRFVWVGAFGRWAGTGSVSIMNLYLGVSFVLGGTGWGEEILRTILPTRITYLINLCLSKGWVGWAIIVTVEAFLLAVFSSCIVLPTFLLIDKRRRQGQL